MRLPDTYLLIAAIGVLVFLLALFIPAGSFELADAPDGLCGDRVVIDPNSFRFHDDEDGPTLFSTTEDRPGLFNAVFEGLVSGSRTGGAVGIMAFILLVGGAFGIVLSTGAVERFLLRLLSGKPKDGRILLASLFLAFSLGGAVFGMSEEVVPFVLLIMPVMIRLGYDGVTGVLVTYAATQVGFASSWMNPFNVAIAQGIAGLPVLSGMGYRILMWSVCTAFGLAFTLWYATRIRATPTENASSGEAILAPLGSGDLWILGGIAATVAWIVWGVVVAGYYLPEIATQFVVLGLFAALVGSLARLNGMTPNGAMDAFREGAQALLPAALIVGFARGIVYLMGGDDPTQPSLLNTVLHAGGETLGGLPAWLAAWLMLIGQSGFNFFVTSGSGQAALTMPLLAPLSDVLGVTRQVAVLAFQLGDGVTNLVVPTSASLMACLGAARLEWQRWVRATFPLLVGLLGLASLFVLLAVATGYQ